MSYSNQPVGSLLAVVFLTIGSPASALADAPARVSFQGYVTDDSGVPVNGASDLTFSLYAVETGGTALYQETQTVVADNGQASVEIGAVSALDLSLFRDFPDLYLGLALGVDPELSPRLHLAASPYAASAAFAADATTLQGLSPADLQSSATPPAANVAYDNSGTDLDATTSQGAINALLARIQSLESRLSTLQTTVTDQQSQITELRTELQSQITGNAGAISDLKDVTDNLDAVAADHETRLTLIEGQDLDARLSPVEAKTASMSVSTIDGQPAVVLTGVNVVIRNGTGSTSQTNGTGNLVIGYNTLRGDETDVRAGSHNLVLGDKNSHTAAAYASLLAGYQNEVQAGYTATIAGLGNVASGPHASVTGGYQNTASGSSASVTGGANNTASSSYASVTGGYHNTASSFDASVTGGFYNTASGSYASVTGGHSNTASGSSASVTGGRNNRASSYSVSVTGGISNSASYYYASVTGGVNNTASGYCASVTGGYSNSATANHSLVSGGAGNSAEGVSSTVSGGASRTTTSDYDWRAGSLFEDY